MRARLVALLLCSLALPAWASTPARPLGFGGTVPTTFVAVGSCTGVAGSYPPGTVLTIRARWRGPVSGRDSVAATIGTHFHFSKDVPVGTYTVYVLAADGPKAGGCEDSAVVVIDSLAAATVPARAPPLADTTSAPPPTPPPTLCWTGGVGWQSFPTSAPRTGVYVSELDATPSLAPMDASFGFAATAATTIQGVAAIIWFRPTGFIEVRNGSAYGLSGFRYTAGQRYHFRLVIDVPTRRYSVYVRVGVGSEQTLALNYAFRTEQVAVTSINYLVLASGFSGTYQICGWTR